MIMDSQAIQTALKSVSSRLMSQSYRTSTRHIPNGFGYLNSLSKIFLIINLIILPLMYAPMAMAKKNPPLNTPSGCAEMTIPKTITGLANKQDIVNYLTDKLANYGFLLTKESPNLVVFESQPRQQELGARIAQVLTTPRFQINQRNQQYIDRLTFQLLEKSDYTRVILREHYIFEPGTQLEEAVEQKQDVYTQAFFESLMPDIEE